MEKGSQGRTAVFNIFGETYAQIEDAPTDSRKGAPKEMPGTYLPQQ